MGNLFSVHGVAATVLAAGLASQPVEAQNPTPPPILIPAPPAPAAPPPAAGGLRVARPTGNPGEWVTENDYPAKALREGAEGTTAFHLTIGGDGTVTGCTVTSSSGSAELDDLTCRLISQRARFSPALNAKGQPIEGSYNSRIRWVIPKESAPSGPVQLAPFSRVVSFWVETDGSITQCRVTMNGVDTTASDKRNPCAAGGKVAPIIDASGKPVRRYVTLSNSLTIADPAAKPAPRKKRPGR